MNTITSVPVRHGLIIANGSMPSFSIIQSLVRKCDIIICADGGANAARRMGIMPDVILGDLDSISRTTRRYFSSVPLLRIREQESTDLEKALRYSIRWKLASVDIIGATGGRIDHTAGALACFRKFGHRIRIQMHDDTGILSLVGKQASFPASRGTLVSLIPLVRCTGITTKNLRYALRNGTLEPGGRQGISNRSTAGSIGVDLKRGTLLVFVHRRATNFR